MEQLYVCEKAAGCPLNCTAKKPHANCVCIHEWRCQAGKMVKCIPVKPVKPEGTGKLIESLILEVEHWRGKYLKECDLWEEVEKANRELAGEWAALLVDRDDWKAKYEESEASRKKLKEGVTALASLLTEAMAKVRVKCPRCQRFLDKSGRCDFCAKRLDHPDSKGATVEAHARYLP
jgi:hypothetical protein